VINLGFEREVQNALKELAQTSDPARSSERKPVDSCDRAEKISLQDLKPIGLLGCGGFGHVELVEDTTTEKTYARKALNKFYAVNEGMVNVVLQEKHVLMVCSSPFICKLYTTYTDIDSLYFVLEAQLGGELYATYKRNGFYGSEQHARYYIASISCALEHLHERFIVCRGVKPEDCVLDSQGRLKLVDMGLATFSVGLTYTTVGTPEYFAPEVITRIGHGIGYDWWALGIICFEFLAGTPPFTKGFANGGLDVRATYSSILKGIEKVCFPSPCKGSVETLIRKLLEKEPMNRLPMRHDGMQEFRRQAWFADFDWGRLMDGTLEAPYIPAVRSNKDLANFFAKEEDKNQTLGDQAHKTSTSLYTLGDPDVKPCKTPGCKFRATRDPHYCCKKCSKSKGKSHGKRCQRATVPEKKTSELHAKALSKEDFRLHTQTLNSAFPEDEMSSGPEDEMPYEDNIAHARMKSPVRMKCPVKMSAHISLKAQVPFSSF